jgi:UMF1 family MFS transporter
MKSGPGLSAKAESDADSVRTVVQALNPGVARREVWAWAMYDFANSGYTTVVLTTVFSAYFVGVVAAGVSWGTLAFTAALSFSYLMVMLTMPAMGARADARAGKRRLLFTSTAGCVAATLLLALTGPGDIVWGLFALALSNYCYCVGESIVAAFLPEIARPEALGRVSGWGWSFGYFGGMLTLGLSLALVSWAGDHGMAASQYVPYVLVLTAAVFAIAAVPSFLFLRERTPPSMVRTQGMLARLATAWRETGKQFRDFRLLLLCGACYHAGISVVITLSAVYATEAMGFTMAQTMMLVFTVNIAAAAGAFLFGYAQDRVGHKPALGITLAGWILMIALAYAAIQLWVFWLAATVAGLCMGTSQSAGRAMVGALAPRHRLAEFYSLWTFATQLAAVVGPLCYGLVAWLTDGNHRLALLFTGLFFVAGLAVLANLDFVRGAKVRDTLTMAQPVP